MDIEEKEVETKEQTKMGGKKI